LVVFGRHYEVVTVAFIKPAVDHATAARKTRSFSTNTIEKSRAEHDAGKPNFAVFEDGKRNERFVDAKPNKCYQRLCPSRDEPEVR
jgi:hypothetical protein